MLLVDRHEAALQRVVDTLGDAVASYAVADVTQPAEAQGYIQTALERYQGLIFCSQTPALKACYSLLSIIPLTSSIRL